jgi:predicted TIM-barrel enzyme
MTDDMAQALRDALAAKELLSREIEILLQIVADHGDPVLSEKVQDHVRRMPARAAASGLRVSLPN